MIELLLAATFRTRQDGQEKKFLAGPPGAQIWERNVVVELFHTKLGLLATARQLRSCGPSYLRNLSIRELENKLTDFLTANYWLLFGETWGRPFETSFSMQVSAATKAKLANALAASDILAPRNVLTLFPLVPVKVATDFDSDSFFLIQPSSLNTDRLRLPRQSHNLLSEQFPPLPDWKGVRETPSAWLGVRSPTLSTSKKLRSAILGSVALLPHPRERHLFTGRKIFGGHITIDDKWSIAFGEEHTPPLSQDIVIGSDDHKWLSVLAAKFVDPSTKVRKQINALEYYYRAWPLNEVERFPIFFMALDAIFGDASQATQAVVEAVGPIMGPSYNESRLKQLLSLRASVIHGGAPNVYDSTKYFAYYEKYVQDPIYDLEVITARCLQSVVFGGTLVSRPHTYADLIKAKSGIDI